MSLNYRLLPELIYYMDITPFVRMLCAMECTMMRVIRYANENLIFQGDVINFAQNFKEFCEPRLSLRLQSIPHI